VLARVEELVAEWSPGVDGDELAAAWALIDRFTAKATAACGELDAAQLWELDGAASLTAWLQDRARMSGARASATARLARRCRAWPVTAEAWEGGALSGGQVAAISANVPAEAVELFADHERAVVPDLVPLRARETVVAMQRWRARAQAVLAGRDDGRNGPRSRLHCSKTLDGRRRLDGDLDVADGEIVAAALRLAESLDVGGEPTRLPAERRAGAAVDVCRHYLDLHATQTPHTDASGEAPAGADRHPSRVRVRGRVRPHLNVICDLDDLADPHGLVRLLDGTPLDLATSRSLLCDAGLHRVLTRGRSVVLDYGTTSRTVPDALFQALVVRDRGCRFPGCHRPPEWTEAHHLVPWSQGGPPTWKTSCCCALGTTTWSTASTATDLAGASPWLRTGRS
jgi:hypothetical protein